MSTPIERPLLAHKIKEEDLSRLRYPLLATPKIDGIRCIVKGGKALTRTFKEVPNRHIQALVSQLPSGLDGELVLPGVAFNEISSAVMSRDGAPHFEYHVFDYVPGTLHEQYVVRLAMLAGLRGLPPFVKRLTPTGVGSRAELLTYEEQTLSAGYEGIMLRTPESPYKCGRSTLKELYLVALKRFEDSEAEIVGFEEQYHNGNEVKKNELGLTKRATHKDKLVPLGTLGALIVRDLTSGVEFKIGTGEGLDDYLKQYIWNNRAAYKGRIITYTYQKMGTKDKPRIPSFKGFRDKRDM